MTENGGALRASFTWRGKRCRETLALEPSAPNTRFAERLVATIRIEIVHGVFDYAKHFPDSKRIPASSTPAIRFETLAERWLKTRGRLAPATQAQYRSHINTWRELVGAKTRVSSVTRSELAAIVGAHPWRSPKACNNAMNALRGVFHLAARDGLCADPTIGIENMPVPEPVPDPLTREEAAAIVAELNARYDPQIGRYFECQLLTGMRPEEAIALRWSDVDWGTAKVRVQRARTFRGRTKGTKAGDVRDVDLVPRAMQLLKQ